MNSISSSHNSRKWTILGATTAAVAATAATGSWATDPNTAWYKTRRKPSFQPPKWAFPVAWTALYADIAAVCGLSIAELDKQKKESERTALIAALGTNLALNAGWSAAFFRGKSPLWATVIAAALAGSSADLTRRCMRVDSARGAFLAPYPAWCAFATALSVAIWRKN